MRNPEYCASREYRKKEHCAPVGRAEPQLIEFARKFVMRCKKIGIPVYVSIYTQNTVCIEHCTLNFLELPPKGFEIFGHLGKEMADQNQMPIVWGGTNAPDTWSIDQASPWLMK